MSVIVYLNDRGEIKLEDLHDWNTSWEDLVDDRDLEEDHAWYPEHEEGNLQEEIWDDIDAAEAECGKGDTYRPVDKEEYNKNHDDVFGSAPKHVCRKFVKDSKGFSICYFCGEPEIDTVTK